MKGIDIKCFEGENFLYKDELFKEKVRIFNNPNGPYKSEKIEIKFKECTFKKRIEFVWDNLTVFFILANPIHDMESLKNAVGIKELPGIATAISFLSRVLMAWAYYEFVAAFRKFGKGL